MEYRGGTYYSDVWFQAEGDARERFPMRSQEDAVYGEEPLHRVFLDRVTANTLYAYGFMSPLLHEQISEDIEAAMQVGVRLNEMKKGLGWFEGEFLLREGLREASQPYKRLIEDYRYPHKDPRNFYYGEH